MPRSFESNVGLLNLSLLLLKKQILLIIEQEENNLFYVTSQFLTKETSTLKLLLYVPVFGQFWQYIACIAELA